MTSSNALLPEKPIQTKRFPDDIQDLILEYVADGIAEGKSIYTAENRCTLFERGTQEKPYDMLVLHVALYNLLRHVVSGEQVEAQAIIEAHPELLFKSGSIKDLSGNTFVGFSPVELARFAHDADMLVMMKPYADKLKNGREKFVAILKKATEYEEAKKQDVYNFDAIVTTITSNYLPSKRIEVALNNFRQLFGPRVIENSEKSYNIKNLRQAYQLYVNHYAGCIPRENELFWSQVIGFLQRSLPACYAQAFCQGLYLYNVIEGGKPLERRLKLHNKQDFYPSGSSDSQGLGFKFGIYTNPGSSVRIARLQPGEEYDIFLNRLDLYVKQKQQCYESICYDKAIEPSSTLAVHAELHNLLRHVVSGEQVEAQAIIEAHPELLFESGRVNDLSGNTFVSFSSVELARFAHDAEMLEMMKQYVDKINGGTEKFAAILKKATEYDEAKKQDIYDFSGIITAITGDHKETRTDALNQFRQTFAPRTIENSEKSYNIKNFQKAYEVYASHYDGWSADRRDLFWCQVIGFLQRSLPACFAQAFCQGLYDVMEGGKPLERRLKLYGGENFYPSDLSVSRGLGFDFGIYSVGEVGRWSRRGEGPAGVWAGAAGVMDIYVKQKQQRCERLCSEPAIERSRSLAL